LFVLFLKFELIQKTLLIETAELSQKVSPMYSSAGSEREEIAPETKLKIVLISTA
jgi:hypothetical protein